MSKPTDIQGLEKQMMIDALNDLIKWCDDKSDSVDIEELTKRNEERAKYLRSLK